MEQQLGVIELSPKQIEFIQQANHRWNGKIGATQCGKTWLDIQYVIPDRILERKGQDGLNVIFGVTKESINRNIIEPLTKKWGDTLIRPINSRNMAMIFGEKVYCLGAEKVSQVGKIRGSQFKYMYIDEMVDISEEVFHLLKSRMSLKYSTCDFTGNPSYPDHWLKRFIDSDADVYCQSWTLYDNPFLDPNIVHEMEKEYSGSVFFKRYVLGEWALAEGLVYPMFADDPDKYIKDVVSHDIQLIVFGLDYGASRSKTTFRATAFGGGFKWIHLIEEFDLEGVHTPEKIYEEFVKFYRKVREKYNINGRYVFGDWGGLGQVINAGLQDYCKKEMIPATVEDCSKIQIFSRIMLTLKLMAQGRLFISPHCKKTIQAFKDAVWDKDKEDTRLDDGSTDIDSLDAFEYSFSAFYDKLIRRS